MIEYAFKLYLKKFFWIYFNDRTIYRLKKEHIQHLQQIFKACKKYGISLNANKCMFLFFFGFIFKYIVCLLDKSFDPKKIKQIQNMLKSCNQKIIHNMLEIIKFNQTFIKKIAYLISSTFKFNKLEYKYNHY